MPPAGRGLGMVFASSANESMLHKVEDILNDLNFMPGSRVFLSVRGLI